MYPEFFYGRGGGIWKFLAHPCSLKKNFFFENIAIFALKMAIIANFWTRYEHFWSPAGETGENFGIYGPFLIVDLYILIIKLN